LLQGAAIGSRKTESVQRRGNNSRSAARAPAATGAMPESGGDRAPRLWARRTAESGSTTNNKEHRRKRKVAVVGFARHATSWSAPSVGGVDIAAVCRADDNCRHEIQLHVKCTMDGNYSVQNAALWCPQGLSATNTGETMRSGSSSHHGKIPEDVTI